MEVNYENLRKKLGEYQEEIDVKIKKCEEEKNYTLAFLFNWIIVEKILKDMENELRKKKLYSQLKEWTEYLEGELEKRPKEISSFTLEAVKIPELTLFRLEKWRVVELDELLKDKSKYRNKRNRIAHHSETVSEKQYDSYKKAVEDAKNEIKNILKNEKQVLENEGK